MAKNHFKRPNYLAIDRPNFKLDIRTESVVVDEKNKRVITTVRWTLHCPAPFDALNSTFWDNFMQTNGVAKGVSVCSDEDAFDVVVGKKISAARAESNAYNNASEIVAGRLRRTSDMLMALNTMGVAFVQKSADVIYHNKNYIDNLVK